MSNPATARPRTEPDRPPVGSETPRTTGGTDAPVPAAEWQITPVRHWGRWVSAVVIAVVLVFLVRAVAGAAIDWSTVGHYLAAGSVLDGFAHTLLLSALAMIMGIVIGTVVAIMRLSRNQVASSLAWFYVWLFRGTPVLLQLLLWFNLAIVFPDPEPSRAGISQDHRRHHPVRRGPPRPGRQRGCLPGRGHPQRHPVRGRGPERGMHCARAVPGGSRCDG